MPKIKKQFHILNHPNNTIYRMDVDDNLNISFKECIGEFSEAIDFQNKGWQKVKDSKIIISLYDYVLKHVIDFEDDGDVIFAMYFQNL